MNDDAGWCGSGGPWITPEQSMQKVVWSETPLEGPGRFDGALPQPAAIAGFYRDIALLAVPLPEAEAAGGKALRIDGIESKAAFGMGEGESRADWPATPASAVIARARVVDLTSRLQRRRHASPGTCRRASGCCCASATPRPAPSTRRRRRAAAAWSATSCRTAGIDAHFAGLMAKLIADVGPLAGQDAGRDAHRQLGSGLAELDRGDASGVPAAARLRPAAVPAGVHRPRRRLAGGLRALPLGPAADDLRSARRELCRAHARTRAPPRPAALDRGLRRAGRRHGLRRPGRRADVRVLVAQPVRRGRHLHGDGFGGARVRQADPGRRGVHRRPTASAGSIIPASIKALGDWAFCEGINRFVFHRYALQPWRDRPPGMSMGPWGLHYERTQTWWEQSKPWHEYLARCQYLLQQGRFVADICYLAPEGAPRHFVPAGRDGARHPAAARRLRLRRLPAATRC